MGKTHTHTKNTKNKTLVDSGKNSRQPPAANTQSLVLFIVIVVVLYFAVVSVVKPINWLI